MKMYGTIISTVHQLDSVLEDITSLCHHSLAEEGLQSPTIFLVSNSDSDLYHFPSFHNTIEDKIGELKRYEIFQHISKEGREEMDRAFESGGLPEVASKMLLCLKSTDNVTLNIGVIGETGAGKSSPVNAIRDVLDDQGGAAPTGVTETTMAPTMYPHPTFHNWELPGLGTCNFQLNNYLEQVGFESYNFFIVVASERFKENHAKLAKRINERGKQFYFARTKIDNEIEASKKHRPSEFDSTKCCN
ncbi:interferon-inducible GTPase 5-like [Heptranchias perlo]|uniref:interferon-inducible GTPase 5-like n=1 Tax=Heptranchias perlo TaxID=212740 RepID=UPI003559EAB4